MPTTMGMRPISTTSVKRMLPCPYPRGESINACLATNSFQLRTFFFMMLYLLLLPVQTNM